MPPPDVKGRPLDAVQEGGPDAQSAAITTASITSTPGNGALRAAVTAVYPPDARRTLWWAAWLCPACGGSHFSRARTEAGLGGERRPGCGRMVVLTVAAG